MWGKLNIHQDSTMSNSSIGAKCVQNGYAGMDFNPSAHIIMCHRQCWGPGAGREFAHYLICTWTIPRGRRDSANANCVQHQTLGPNWKLPYIFRMGRGWRIIAVLANRTLSSSLALATVRRRRGTIPFPWQRLFVAPLPNCQCQCQ
jgi:hypothetical protein